MVIQGLPVTRIRPATLDSAILRHPIIASHNIENLQIGNTSYPLTIRLKKRKNNLNSGGVFQNALCEYINNVIHSLANKNTESGETVLNVKSEREYAVQEYRSLTREFVSR